MTNGNYLNDTTYSIPKSLKIIEFHCNLEYKFGIMRKGFVYIMSNKYRTTFYIGVTSAIKRRVLEHKTGKGTSTFTSRYNLFDLLHYEIIEGMAECIEREKQLKNWHRTGRLI